MLSDLQGKLIVVTGSTGGIGFAIASTFARNGAIVTINGRSLESCNKAIDTLLSAESAAPVKKEQLLAIPGDVVSAEGAEKFYADIKKASQSPVYALVLNVGVYDTQDYVNTTDADEIKYYENNVLSSSRLAKMYLKDFTAANSGSILFVSSESAFKPLPNMALYSMTKAAQVSISRSIAEIAKGTRVRCNSLLPGPTATAGVMNYFKSYAKDNGYGDKVEEAIASYFKEHEPTSLIQRLLDPQEVANVAVFLSSSAASGITGNSQRVEGGIIRHV